MWIISMQALVWDMVICLGSTRYAWFEFSRFFLPCEGLSKSSFTAESITISQRWGLYFSQTPWWPLTSFIAFFFLENVLVLGFHLPPWCATNHCGVNYKNVNKLNCGNWKIAVIPLWYSVTKTYTVIWKQHLPRALQCRIVQQYSV